MNFTRFQSLPPYPFPRMRALLEGLTPDDTSAALNLSVGEPQHAVPDFVTEILTREQASYNKYPPVQGTDAWQAAVAAWLTRRNNLAPGQVTAAHLVPLAGSREGLFSIGLVAINRQKQGQAPLVLSPNPFYQPYAGAAAAAGAETLYVAGSDATGGMPDYAALPKEILQRTALAFICNPSNPEGALASRAYLKQMLTLAREYDFILVGDECYSEIYHDQPPVGLMDVCGEMAADGSGTPANPFDHAVVFNSLSKRSNLAGLRSGFMAGDPRVVAETIRMRSYGGAPLPLPIQAASAAAWAEEDHVIHNRALYRRKFDLAEQYLGDKFNFQRPGGGFCVWLNVGDGEAACRTLWRKAGIKVLPGAYLARPDAAGHNPGTPYIRLVLVHDDALLEATLEKIANTL
ncbi:aminotransferase class I/II-fold pyridoxal phosphate-dependent enzyme [Paremcibacter congregatus]|uniref:aminotransferase class I/II-fold pyridoxal phosphate-dependent enzyme n=1 Tax=Paremcibacter congregatus TaxID=2043170 RepID=UPI0030EE3FA9